MTSYSGAPRTYVYMVQIRACLWVQFPRRDNFYPRRLPYIPERNALSFGARIVMLSAPCNLFAFRIASRNKWQPELPRTSVNVRGNAGPNLCSSSFSDTILRSLSAAESLIECRAIVNGGVALQAVCGRSMA